MVERITFWNGLHSIGSNIFSIDNGEDRLIMDFGMPNETHSGDSDTPVTEALINAGKLPEIPYLYDTRNFTKALPGVQDSEYQRKAVFVSHLHLDHNSGLKYLPKGTAVYMSEETKRLYDALLACGMESAIEAELHGIPFNEAMEVGEYTVTFIQNDHDTVGSSSILIEAENRRILHSGDIRKNGYHPGNITKLIETVKPVDLLLIEGTSFSFLDEGIAAVQRTERDLLDDFAELLMDEKNNIVINPYPRNIDRLIALNHLSLKLERPIHWDKKFSKLLKMYTEDPVHTWTDLNDKQNRVIQLHFDDMEQLSSLNPGNYVHMNGEPLGDYDPRYEVLQGKLRQAQFEFMDYSVSGHASKEDILNIAEELNSHITIPWHTFEPEKQAEKLKERGLNVYLPELGKEYLLDDLMEK